MKTNFFKIGKNEPRIKNIVAALKTIEGTTITLSIDYLAIRTPSLALCSEMIEIDKEEYYKLINPFGSKAFYSVESDNGQFKVWVSKPKSHEVIVTTSFNLYDYSDFTSQLVGLSYIHVKNTHKAENFCSICVDLLEDGALTNLMEDLADLLAKDVAKDLQAVPA